jgi:hypothetical protein
MEYQERDHLRGDYLFVIDNEPRFILTIDSAGVFSCEIRPQYEELQPENLSVRTSVFTSSAVLERLLRGSLKARIAFVTGKVQMNGDLPALLKVISFLKKNGIQARFAKTSVEPMAGVSGI